MIKILITFLFLNSFFVFSQYANEIDLEKNESISPIEFCDLREFTSANNDLIFSHSFDELDTIIFNADYNVNDLYQIIEDSDYEIDYQDLTINLSWYSRSFMSYLHSIFQNKLARQLLFNWALNELETLCIGRSVEFLEKVIKELEDLIEYTKIKNYYTTELSWSSNYWKKFIYRRVENDGVPLNEINTYLLKAKEELTSINKTELLNNNRLCEVIINNELHVILGYNDNSEYDEYYEVTLKKLNGEIEKSSFKESDINNEYYSEKSEGDSSDSISSNLKIYKYSDEDEFQVKSIKYLKDETGSFYLIEGDDFRDLYDSNLNKL